MSTQHRAVESSDRTIVDFLRRKHEATVGDLVDLLGVTATAVRQKLTRLMDMGLVDRQSTAAGRGRPVHRYSLTQLGVRSAGDNYGPLAQVLWDEVRAIDNPEVRQGLLKRISHRLAEVYRDQVVGETLAARMASFASLVGQNGVPFVQDGSRELPVLTALACPFPDLAERDRSVCAMEKMMISEALGEQVRLSACRLDGATCCTFEASSAPVGA